MGLHCRTAEEAGDAREEDFRIVDAAVEEKVERRACTAGSFQRQVAPQGHVSRMHLSDGETQP
jgi:hypothetical protein